MNRPAVDYRLKQALVQMIGSRIDRLRLLSCVTEFLSHPRIQEISAGHKLGEQSESCRIALLQFCDERRGWTSDGRRRSNA